MYHSLAIGRFLHACSIKVRRQLGWPAVSFHQVLKRRSNILACIPLTQPEKNFSSYYHHPHAGEGVTGGFRVQLMAIRSRGKQSSNVGTFERTLVFT